ncbi:NrfJ [Nitrosomonas sp.]|uniref:NrfJ n=1 Tax=Nitrosomonas sp. TaxID=42353 RepID=UPI0025E311D1|nr:NrfJ [Nitrosomonas sp.]MCC6915802.1 NrfJ [Nitrosomonas sp.]
MLKTVFAAMLTVSLASVNLSAAYAEEAPKVETMPADEGIVVSSIDAAGYTYMELANGDKKIWIAAPTTKVSNGEHIRFVENMRMHNFTSKTLNRTFNELIFVTSTQTAVAK